MAQQWQEGPHAEPEAARERYDADLRASRRAVRAVLSVELPVAHLGLALVVIVSGIACAALSPTAGAVIAGAFAGLFVVALAVAFAVGRRGWRAVRSAYKFAFGWANWITP